MEKNCHNTQVHSMSLFEFNFTHNSSIKMKISSTIASKIDRKKTCMSIARVNNSITEKNEHFSATATANRVTASQLTVDSKRKGKNTHNSNKIFMNRNENTEKQRVTRARWRNYFLPLYSFGWRHHFYRLSTTKKSRTMFLFQSTRFNYIGVLFIAIFTI